MTTALAGSLGLDGRRRARVPVTIAGVVAIQAAAGNRATLQALRSGTVVQRALDAQQADVIARRLREAMAGWGTDEEAVYGALSGRTSTDTDAIKDAYQRLYDTSLQSDINDEFSGDELARANRLLRGSVAPGPEASAKKRQGAATSRAAEIARHLQEAMQGWGTEEDEIYNALAGRTADEIDEIRRQYYALTGHSLDRDIRDEMSGSELERALALINSGNSGSFRNTVSEYLTEGLNASVDGIWDWEIVNDRFLVHVDVSFEPDEGVAFNLGRFQTQIANVWNRFALTDGKGKELPVLFDLKDQSRAERSVRVQQNAVPGTYADPDRAYSDLWYPVMPDTVAPHEFGHLIGLADEYERTAEDYRSVTGEPIPVTHNTSHQTPQQIAADLHAALYDHPKAERAPAATTVLENAGLMVGGAAQQGTFAQQVMQAYDDEYSGWFSKTLIEAIRDRCVAGSFWNLLWTFSFESNTIMGNMSDHTHPVAPRHLAPVLETVRRRYPNRAWGLKLLR